jgi:membrane protease YdiL (CAAX protease family)
LIEPEDPILQDPDAPGETEPRAILPRPVPPPPPFPTIWQGVGLVFLLFLALNLCPVWIRSALRREGIEIGALALSALGNTLAFGLMVPIALALTRRPVRESLPFRPVPLRFLPLMAMIILGWMVVALKLDLIVQRIWPVPEELSDFFLELVSRQGNPFLQILLLVIVAPITEELFFRGVLLQGFLKRYPFRKAILASAFLFSLTHANPWQFIPTFGLGLYFAWWCARTGSLWPALFGHALHNGLPWMLFLAQTEDTGPALPVEEIPLGPGLIEIFGLLMMITGSVLLARQFQAADLRLPRPEISGPPPAIED